jgi:hypothetical protein
MINNQKQEADEGSTAIQSGRDTIINQGISSSELQLILSSIRDNVESQMSLAKELLKERLDAFEARMFIRFSDKSSSRVEAFSDPDFRCVVAKAQIENARANDDQICSNLIDLIALRSMQNDRTRLSLTLNEAVDRAAVLTKEEFAELSLVFLLRYSRLALVNSWVDVANYLNVYAIPLLDEIAREESAYLYLVSHSCATIELASIGVYQLIVGNYGGCLSKGFDEEQLRSLLPESKQSVLNDFLMPCINDASKLQLSVLAEQDFQVPELSNDERKNVWNMFQKTFWSETEVIERFKALVPRISDLFELWNTTPLERLLLTSVGMALGFSNARRLGWDGRLEVFIK